MSKKLISIVVPNYNEAATLDELYERTTKVMQSLDKYDYEIIFIINSHFILTAFEPIFLIDWKRVMLHFISFFIFYFFYSLFKIL